MGSVSSKLFIDAQKLSMSGLAQTAFLQVMLSLIHTSTKLSVRQTPYDTSKTNTCVDSSDWQNNKTILHSFLIFRIETINRL